MSSLVGFVLMLSGPGYLILQPWALLKLTGRAQIAALAPLIASTPVILWCGHRYAG
jgi:hypothetical protein